MIYRSAKLAPQLGREYNMICDCNLIEHDYDTSSHSLSHSVTCNSVTYNVTVAKMLTTFLRHLTYFIQKYPLKGHSIHF